MQIDLFSQVHGVENNSTSQDIYNNQSKRLSENTRIILQCLIEGQELSGHHLVYYGAKPLNAEKPKQMIEYRRRMLDIKRAGIELNEVTDSNGCKTWSLPESEKEKAREVLKKCK